MELSCFFHQLVDNFLTNSCKNIYNNLLSYAINVDILAFKGCIILVSS